MAVDLDQLVDSLEPVRPLRPWRGLVWIAMALVVGTGLVLAVLGPRQNFFAFFSHPLIIGRTTLLILLGAVSCIEIIRMARPRVGRPSIGWQWTLSTSAALVVAAFAYAVWAHGTLPPAASIDYWFWCVVEIAALAAGMAAVMLAWLRRGAPASLAAAGWQTGIAAGSFGTLLYSLHCPHASIAAIAIWYSLSILASGIVGRLLVPWLIRW